MSSDSEDNELSLETSTDKEAPAAKASDEILEPKKKKRKEEIADIPISKAKLAIEDINLQKSLLENILLNPEAYIGSMEYTEKAPMWIYDSNKEKLVYKKISYVPGLYKIFDEILGYAVENKQRDPTMGPIFIDIYKKKNKISIYYTGKGIPVVYHEKENMYEPEMIFCNLLTSSYYDDSEKKVTDGKNGYGVKLCNIFSTKFKVNTSCPEYDKSVMQTWVNNMTKVKNYDVLSCGSFKGHTLINFKPDLAKFKMKELDDDIIGLMCRRAYDIACSNKRVKIFFNDKALPENVFRAGVEQHTIDLTEPTGEPAKVL